MKIKIKDMLFKFELDGTLKCNNMVIGHARSFIPAVVDYVLTYIEEIREEASHLNPKEYLDERCKMECYANSLEEELCKKL